MATKSSPSTSSTSLVKCCECECSCSVMNRSLSGTYLRTVKRKYDEFEEEREFEIPGLIIPQNARVEMGNECVALREMVSSQQVTIQNLISELEEERNASSSAANEAMSMILRLQREKAEIQMEAKQFKRYAEEKMAHDQQEMLALEDLLYKRELAIHSLTCEVQAYKHRMMSYGLTENEAAGENGMSRNNSLTENLQGQFEFPPCEIYPPLKCNSQDCVDGDDGATDIEKYAFGETPRTRDQFKDLERRICHLEESPRTVKPCGEYSGSKSFLEKVVVGQSPRQPRHLKKFSTDSSNSLLATWEEKGPDIATDSPKFGRSFKKSELSHLEEISNSRKVDNASEVGDDFSDRVYTIDSVKQGALPNGLMDVNATVAFRDEEMTSQMESPTQMESPNYLPVKDIEIQKLYARLHALEADRESMRQTIISVGTDKAQLMLLKEIAQNWCQDMSPAKSMPTRKSSAVGSFSFMSVFKWITGFVFWRRKAHKCRYMFGLSANNVGLLMLLDRRPRVGQRRCISISHM
ncbi:myosin-binding protein 7-like isoform X2 [Primulina eburnea]|uniref:myosin-binding protein 7-like isoform X2 n=1 Tax=Primulina eburnea TaxID=1245227 RepID=UPI003C6C9FAC